MAEHVFAGAISVNKHGSLSSVGLERLIVIQEVIGSIPIGYPLAAAVERSNSKGLLILVAEVRHLLLPKI